MVFTSELALRIFGYGIRRFYCGPDWRIGTGSAMDFYGTSGSKSDGLQLFWCFFWWIFFGGFSGHGSWPKVLVFLALASQVGLLWHVHRHASLRNLGRKNWSQNVFPWYFHSGWLVDWLVIYLYLSYIGWWESSGCFHCCLPELEGAVEVPKSTRNWRFFRSLSAVSTAKGCRSLTKSRLS